LDREIRHILGWGRSALPDGRQLVTHGWTGENASRPSWIAYLAAVAFVSVAALTLWLLQPVLGNSVPLTVFLAAVVASAWIGGAGPGLFATLASLIVAHALSLKPRATLAVTPAGYSVRMALFALAGGAISIVNEQRRRAGSAAAKQSEQLFGPVAEHVRQVLIHVDGLSRGIDVPDTLLGRLHDLSEPCLAPDELRALLIGPLRRRASRAPPLFVDDADRASGQREESHAHGVAGGRDGQGGARPEGQSVRDDQRGEGGEQAGTRAADPGAGHHRDQEDGQGDAVAQNGLQQPEAQGGQGDKAHRPRIGGPGRPGRILAGPPARCELALPPVYQSRPPPTPGYGGFPGPRGS
jgi:hypothetical protein